MEERIICADCGKEISDEERCVQLFNGDYVCDDCYNSEDYCRCDDCGEIVRRTEAYDVYDSRVVCEDCVCNYTECECCGELIPDCDINYVDGHCICDDCISSNINYTQCDDCGEWHYIGCLEWNETDRAYYCSECSPYHSY